MRNTARQTLRTACAAGQAIAAATLGHLAHLRYTLTTARRVQIAYVKENGEASVRIIEPANVRRSQAGDWYVRAYDYLRDAHRSFRLDRITAYTAAA